MSGQAQSNGGGSGFLKAFVPGLVVGLVIGALLGATVPVLLDSGPSFPEGNSGSGAASSGTHPDELVREGRRTLEEGAEAIGEAAEEGAEAAEQAAEEALDAAEQAGEEAKDAIDGAGSGMDDGQG